MQNATGLKAPGGLTPLASDLLLFWTRRTLPLPLGTDGPETLLGAAQLCIFRQTSLELVQSIQLPGQPYKVSVEAQTGRVLVAFEGDWSLRVYHFESEKFSGEAELLDGVAKLIACDPLGNLLTLAVKGQTLKLNQQPVPFDTDQLPIEACLLHGKDILWWSRSGHILVNDRLLAEGKVECVYDSTDQVQIIVFMADQQNWKLVKVKPGGLHETLDLKTVNAPNSLLKFSNGHVIEASPKGTINVSPLSSYPDEISSYLGILRPTFLLTHDQLLAIGNQQGRLLIINLDTGLTKFDRRLHSRRIVDIHCIDNYLVTVSEDGSLTIIDEQSFEIKATILSRRSYPLRYGLLDDVHFIIEYSDGILNLWNLESSSLESSRNPVSEVETSGFTHKVNQDNSSSSLCYTVELRQIVGDEPFKNFLKRFILQDFVSDLAIGIHGAGGHMSFHRPGTDLLQTSPVVSALLQTVLLSIDQGLDLDDQVMPSISSLSKFWTDPNEKVQQSSRRLILDTIHKISKEQLSGFVDYWSHFLSGMNRAAIILAIVGSIDSSLLKETIRKAIADSLISQICSDRKNLFRTAAVELIADPLWLPFIQPWPVFHGLFLWLVAMSETIPNSDIVLLTTTENALLKLIQLDRFSIIPFWMGALASSKSIQERQCAIGLIDTILQQRPQVLADYLVLILEHAVRILDPSSPIMRTAMTPIVTSLILDSSRSFSTVALHKETQRVLVASPLDDGTIVMLDLRAATRSHSFEGLTKGSTAIAFSPDSRHFCIYSGSEATVRVWAVPSGILSILGPSSHGKPLKTVIVQPELTEEYLKIPGDLYNAAIISWQSHKDIVILLGGMAFPLEIL